MASSAATIETLPFPALAVRRPDSRNSALCNILPFPGALVPAPRRMPELGLNFRKRQCDVLLAFAKRPGTMGEIGETLGIGEKGARAHIHCVRERSMELSLPAPIVFINPHGFEMNPEFAKIFGIGFERFMPIQLFSKTERAVIDFVLKNPGATSSELAANFGKHFDIFRDRINAKCAERGWPKAIVLSGRSLRNSHYFISSKFLKNCGLPNINSEFEISFTPREARLLMFLADAPWSARNELCGALSLEWGQVKEIIRSIREKDRLALRCIKKDVAHYALSDEFAKNWGFKKPKPFAAMPAHAERKQKPSLKHVQFHKIYLVRLIDELDRQIAAGITPSGHKFRHAPKLAVALDAVGGLRGALARLEKRNATLENMENGALISGAKLGKTNAQNALVLKYERLAFGFAKPYRGLAAAYGIESDDIRQESRLAILDAATDFDPLGAFGLGSLIRWKVRTRSINFILDNKSNVRVPRTVLSSLRKMRKEMEGREKEGLARGTEGMRQLAETRREGLLAMARSDVGRPDVSLNAPVSNEEGSPEKIEFVPADALDMIESLMARAVRENLEAFDDTRKKAILERCFGLKNGRPQSTREIAAHLRIGETTVQGIKDGALEQLKYKKDGWQPFSVVDGKSLKGILVEEPVG